MRRVGGTGLAPDHAAVPDHPATPDHQAFGGTRSSRRIPLVVFAVILGIVWLLPRNRVLADALPTVVYTQYTCVSIWSSPTHASTYIADVIGGTALPVTGATADGAWYHVNFLASQSAWVEAYKVAATPPAGAEYSPDCPYDGIPAIARNPTPVSHGPYPLQGTGSILLPVTLRAGPDIHARVVGTVAPGQRGTVVSWAGDSNGDVWYLAHAGGSFGWLWAYALKFDQPDPATYAPPNGQPVWQAAAGKGMWFTDYLPRHTNIAYLVAAMKAAGMTHIYTRVAESFYGFFDQNTLDRLLPAAHAAGIKVFAFVYPYLNDVATDLAMTQRVLAYRTPSGQQIDGLAADIEERTDPPAVFAYGQVLRQMVGPAFPLVATTYNPRGRPSYPYPEIAANFNVISPQDYWHADQHATYDAQSPRDLLLLSITTIRAELGGRSFPIEELGQMYDMYTDDGTPGASAPSAAEITGDLQAAKDLGCIGISFFEWQTASPDELNAFKAFAWPSP